MGFSLQTGMEVSAEECGIRVKWNCRIQVMIGKWGKIGILRSEWMEIVTEGRTCTMVLMNHISDYHDTITLKVQVCHDT